MVYSGPTFGACAEAGRQRHPHVAPRPRSLCRSRLAVIGWVGRAHFLLHLWRVILRRAAPLNAEAERRACANVMERRLGLDDPSGDIETSGNLDGKGSTDSRPVLDYSSAGASRGHTSRLRAAMGHGDLAGGCLGGFVYTFLATVLSLAGPEVISPNVRLMLLGIVVAVPCVLSFRRRSWRPFAAGILIAIGLGVLLLGICGAIIGGHF